MRECVEAALRNNIDIAVSRSERKSTELGVTLEEAAFLPRFSRELSVSHSSSPTGA